MITTKIVTILHGILQNRKFLATSASTTENVQQLISNVSIVMLVQSLPNVLIVLGPVEGVGQKSSAQTLRTKEEYGKNSCQGRIR